MKERSHILTPQDIAFHRRSRSLTIAVVVLLSIQLAGNIYEELVTNAQSIADPRAGAIVGELEPGSPLFFYLPWVPIGIVLLGVLTAQAARQASAHVARRYFGAAAAIIAAIAAKAILIGWLNPQARDRGLAVEVVQSNSVLWAIINGIAIIAVLSAIVLVLSWRRGVTDHYETERVERAI